MTVAIHQVLPVLAERDAVGDHTIRLRNLLRAHGVQSEIFAADIHPGRRSEARPTRRLTEVGDDAVLVYQASTYSDLAAELAGRANPLVVEYHNITPDELVAPFEPKVATELRIARRQVISLAPRAALGMAVSRFNADELLSMGYARTAVTPFLTSIADHAPGSSMERTGTSGSRWLFVGRLAPNKAQHDVVLAFAAHRRLFDPAARLRLVGTSASDSYCRFLVSLVDELEVAEAVDLVGSVTDAELDAEYSSADVFVCLSDHEGFGVPLLEAMAHGLPVVAFDAAAVPETLGDAGVLLPDKDPALVAAVVHRVVSDAELRGRLIGRGRARLDDFGLEAAEQAHLDALAGVADLR